MALFLSLFSMALALAICESASVTGLIKFPGSPAADASKPGSCLIVVLEDTSRMDMPAQTLARNVDRNPQFDSDNQYQYKLPEFGIPKYAHSIAVRATLNVGWCKEDDKNEKQSSVKLGDYLTDTEFLLDIQDGVTDYKKDFNVIHYQ